ncbi:MAG: MFS transporter [Gammaproteobacteria bacterium]|nr:MFS transporter [Gammaproteobacteria bacterium]
MSAGSGRRQVDRAALVDQHFRDFLRTWRPAGSALTDSGDPGGTTLLELFESQMTSRQLDLMARKLRLEDKVFYTIGSAGHEGNAVAGRLMRATDPAFLHYRSGALMAEQSRKDGSYPDFIRHVALSLAASSEDPVSGGRHKVWGSRGLWTPPQTSTIASHLPKAVGTALAVEQARRLGRKPVVPHDSVVVCSFGDASLNHSTAQGALNAALWTVHQGLPVPLLLICEDNQWGISVPTPPGWVRHCVEGRNGLRYLAADGTDLESTWAVMSEAFAWCRERRRPVLVHLGMVRLMGHAGTDFEVDYREISELEAAEKRDPLLRSAARVLEAGLMDAATIGQRYAELGEACEAAGRAAAGAPRLRSAIQVMAPLAPCNRERLKLSLDALETDDLPGDAAPLARHINRALGEALAASDDVLVFGEDVGRKGGVYTVTRGLQQRFGPARVFNTLLDEQTILGLAQGCGLLGFLPIPEIQYLAYFHNASDQVRGEAASTGFFSAGQFHTPMVIRIASLAYQKGFGGHFHNDNSIAALRDIPGLLIACPSRGDDAVAMLRTCIATARNDGRVCAFLEPIALYMTRDLYQTGDGAWQFAYPGPEVQVLPGEARFYGEADAALLVITYGNGVRMTLRALREAGVAARIMDLRWLGPLNRAAITQAAEAARAVLVVDEGRRSGGVGEGILATLAEAGIGRVACISGADSYLPLGPAAAWMLPDEGQIATAARALLA